MNIRIKTTPVAGPATVEFANDYLIELEFLDVATGETLHDFTGPNALHISQVLASLPAEAVADIVANQAVDLVKLARGIS